MKIAVLGYGTVGSGVVEVLDVNQKLIASRAKEKIEVKYVLDLRDFPGDKIQEKIVHDFCRIFEHNMVHFLKYIMLSTANDLIRMVYRSMTKRFYIGNFPFYLKFTDNLFKL